MEHQITRPAWAEINLDNLKHNISEVRRVVKKEALVTAVIKADGYGHGAVEIGQTLLDNGADRFAVATQTEAIQLRKYFANTEILVLGYTPSELLYKSVEHKLIQTIYTLEQGEVISKAAKNLSLLAKVHIKLDTGMHRLGLPATIESVHVIESISQLKGVEIEGIYTHFAVADEVSKSYTQGQVDKYNYVINELEKRAVNIPIKHVSNSAAIIDMPELNYNMVRAGIMLYGLYPSKDVLKQNVELREVMSLKAKVTLVKYLSDGDGISYGLKYKVENHAKIATLPLGYADGFTRMLSGKASAIVAKTGDVVPVVGRICMDQCMINVTGLDVERDDEIILFGSSKSGKISIDDVADHLDTINYEIVCMIDKRIPRVYIKDNDIVKVRDYVLEL